MFTNNKKADIDDFADFQKFQKWFRKPVKQILKHDQKTINDEIKTIVQKFYNVLKSFIMKRLKIDVKKQMSKKYEHAIICRLSRRQQYLYDEFMSRIQIKKILTSDNYLSIISCLMQLHKMCNHFNLFKIWEIVTSYVMSKSVIADYEIKDLLVWKRFFQQDLMSTVNKGVINLLLNVNESFFALNTIQRQRLVVQILSWKCKCFWKIISDVII